MVSVRGIISFFYFGLCLIAVAFSSDHSHKHEGGGCDRVKAAFSHHKIGSPSLVPDSKVKNPGLLVCGQELKHHKSCCTRDTEVKYVEAAERYLKDSLRSSNAYLKKLVVESLAQFQERIFDLLEEAQNRTTTSLVRVHNIPLEEIHGTVSDLFMDMEQYAKQNHVNIKDSIKRFFMELFPSVFYYILSDPSVIRYDDHYRTCLARSMELIEPFDKVPTSLANKVERAFHRARSFVNALSVIREAINATDNIEFDRNCREAATRLQYCSHCHGYVGVKPCHGFCLNVIGGCLATVSEISPAWDELMSAIEALTKDMKNKNSLEDVLSGMERQIRDGILFAMDNGPRVYDKVMSHCQNLTTRSVPTRHLPKNTGLTKSKSRRRPAPTYSLMDQLTAVLKKLMDSRGIYNRLASEICGQQILYEQDMQSSNCWNGVKIGRYEKLIPESSFIAQAKANPEVKVDVRPNYNLLSVKDKLIHVTENLRDLTEEKMQSDGPEEYYASGERRINHKDVIINDDEDLYDPSGSGSGEKPPPATDRPRPPIPPVTPKSSGPAVIISWSLTTLCYFLVTVMHA